MAEKRKKSHAILLTIGGKPVSVELFDALLWPEKSSTEGLFRVRIDGKWYCPAGKYSFLTLTAVGDLVAQLLSEDNPLVESARPALTMRQRVKVHYGDCVGGLPMQSRVVTVQSPPWRCVDGRWHIFVGIDGYIRSVPCSDVEALGGRG